MDKTWSKHHTTYKFVTPNLPVISYVRMDNWLNPMRPGCGVRYRGGTRFPTMVAPVGSNILLRVV